MLQYGHLSFTLKEFFKMAQRTGVPTLIKIAQRMCQVIVQFAPIIQRAYPSNAALHAALAAAMAACSVLEAELVEVRAYGD
jgi:hypothetical protein